MYCTFKGFELFKHDDYFTCLSVVLLITLLHYVQCCGSSHFFRLHCPSRFLVPSDPTPDPSIWSHMLVFGTLLMLVHVSYFSCYLRSSSSCLRCFQKLIECVQMVHGNRSDSDPFPWRDFRIRIRYNYVDIDPQHWLCQRKHYIKLIKMD